jgi:ribosomal protein L37AE/L43A
VNRYQQAEGCPGCGGTEGVDLTRTTSQVSVWKCTRCGVTWAVSVVNPHLRGNDPAALAARVERLSAARLILREVITLADEASTLTDLELRDRLRALAQGAW